MTKLLWTELAVVASLISFAVTRPAHASGFECSGEDCNFMEGVQKRNYLSVVEDKPKFQAAPKEVVQNSIKKAGPKPKVKRRDILRTTRSAPQVTPVSQGNLPPLLVARHLDASDFSNQGIVQGLREPIVKLQEIRQGDILTVKLDQAIKASPGAKSPIRVMVLGGMMNGSFLIGEASLDRELKRVFLDFQHLRTSGSDEIYDLSAEGLSPSGAKGIEGEYHSEEGKFLIASFIGGFLGNLTDAQVNRTQTAYGAWTAEPTLSNSAKIAAGATLVQGANRLAERAERAPEYTETEGNQVIRVFIKSDPVRKL